MLFTVVTKVNGRDLAVVLLSKEILEDGSVLYCNTLDILYDFDVQSILAQLHKVTLTGFVKDNIKLVLPVTAETGVINIAGLLAKVKPYMLNRSEKNDKVIKAAFKTVDGFNDEDYEQLCAAVKKYYTYLEKGAEQKIEYAEQFLADSGFTLKVIREINIVFDEASYVRNNETVFMSSPLDEVYITVPTPEDFERANFVSGLKLQRYAKPYKESAYYSFMDSNQLNQCPPEDLAKLKGYASNNDLDIQPNEQRFYDSLKEAIDCVYEKAYGENKTAAEYVKEGKFIEAVADLLAMYAIKVASWNWGYTGMYILPAQFNPDVDEDDDDDEDSDNSDKKRQVDESLGKNTFTQTSEVPVDGPVKAVNYADKLLRGFLISVAKKDPYASAEAIVKLARWGSRKPTKLKLNADPNYLDLATYNLTSRSGSFKNTEIVKVNGAEFTLSSFIGSSNRVLDKQYISKYGKVDAILIPFGVVLDRKYIDGSVQHEVMSLPSLILYLQKHPDNIEGIKFINGKLVSSVDYEDPSQGAMISQDEVYNNVLASYDGIWEFYNNDNIIDLFFAFECYDKTITELNNFLFSSIDITGDIETYSINSKAELLDKFCRVNNISEENKRAININDSAVLTKDAIRQYCIMTINKRFIELVATVNQEYFNQYVTGKSPDVNEVLNMYYLEMVKQRYDSPYLQDNKESEVQKDISSDLEKMSVFGDYDQDKEEEVMIKDNIIMKAPADATYYKVLVKSADNTVDVIGYVAKITVNGKGKYLLTKELPEGVKVAAMTMNANQLVKAALRDFYFSANGKIEHSLLRFASVKDWEEISTAIFKKM